MAYFDGNSSSEWRFNLEYILFSCSSKRSIIGITFPLKAMNSFDIFKFALKNGCHQHYQKSMISHKIIFSICKIYPSTATVTDPVTGVATQVFSIAGMFSTCVSLLKFCDKWTWNFLIEILLLFKAIMVLFNCTIQFSQPTSPNTSASHCAI